MLRGRCSVKAGAAAARWMGTTQECTANPERRHAVTHGDLVRPNDTS